MAYGSGRKEDERYCYNCTAILPTKVSFEHLHEKCHDNVTAARAFRVCIKCLKEVKPPEESNTEQE